VAAFCFFDLRVSLRVFYQVLDNLHQFDLKGDVFTGQGVVGVEIDFIVAYIDYQDCQLFIVFINQHDFVSDLGVQVFGEIAAGNGKNPFLVVFTESVICRDDDFFLFTHRHANKSFFNGGEKLALADDQFPWAMLAPAAAVFGFTFLRFAICAFTGGIENRSVFKHPSIIDSYLVAVFCLCHSCTFLFFLQRNVTVSWYRYCIQGTVERVRQSIKIVCREWKGRFRLWDAGRGFKASPVATGYRPSDARVRSAGSTPGISRNPFYAFSGNSSTILTCLGN
jgi:hypothetical protein